MRRLPPTVVDMSHTGIKKLKKVGEEKEIKGTTEHRQHKQYTNTNLLL